MRTPGEAAEPGRSFPSRWRWWSTRRGGLHHHLGSQVVARCDSGPPPRGSAHRSGRHHAPPHRPRKRPRPRPLTATPVRTEATARLYSNHDAGFSCAGPVTLSSRRREPAALSRRAGGRAGRAATAMAWLRHQGAPADVVLTGPRGNGKTVLLGWLARELRDDRSVNVLESSHIPTLGTMTACPTPCGRGEDRVESVRRGRSRIRGQSGRIHRARSGMRWRRAPTGGAS